ncbi:protein SMIM45 [Sorex araneus]|uniref:protein SMIM45 n=2 Tax=Sorex TaxID=9379 RepID=UPI0024340769|nr:protein SMIM45 [Sorex araneus]
MGRERFQGVEPAHNSPLPAWPEALSPGGAWPPPPPFASSTQGGCRRQRLWGRPRRRDPQASAELPRPGPCAQPRSCRRGIGRAPAPAAVEMPHFLDWFVPLYLVISVLILVGFGACIYYFEPGLQEAHKWRMQRPLVDRDLRKTLMVRDNLAFGGAEA